MGTSLTHTRSARQVREARRAARRRIRRFATAATAVVAVAATMLTASGATAASIAVEAESWAPSGPASVGTDLAASGGKYVAFTRGVDGGEPLPAFPGAQGFGATTPGGRGGKVMEVTTLADSGAGSLRACAEASGPRICVFRIGGTIELLDKISIKNPYITIAGQSAPGGGITIKGAPSFTDAPLKIKTHDVVLRYLRVRPGPTTSGTTMRSGIRFEAGPHHVVLDHVSVSWAVDDNLTLIDGTRDITIQWSIISEALHDSSHSEGPHSKGIALSGKQYDSTAETGNISIHHNLIAYNDDRNPRHAAFGLVDFVNNVVYDWGATGFELVDNKAKVPANVVGNYFKKGVDSDAYEVAYDAQGTGFGAAVYVNGNLGPNRTSDAQPQSDIVDPGSRQWIVPTRFPAPAVTTTNAATAWNDVLTGAGARYPHVDSVDARVANQVRNGTGQIIDSPTEVGGWPTLAPGTPPVDGDHDGMPDTWESSRGLDPARDDSTGDRNGDGFTNVEEYLNGLVGSPDAGNCPSDATGGAVAGSITAATAGDYHVWSRVRSSDGLANAYWLQVGGTCRKVGGTSLNRGEWTWIAHENGQTGRRLIATLGAGSHSAKLIGGTEGLHVDRLLLTTDAGCVPTGTDGANCQGTPTTTATTSTTAAPTSSTTTTSTSTTTSTTTTTSPTTTTQPTTTTSPTTTTTPTTTTSPVAIPPPPPASGAVDMRIASRSDDVEERGSGSISFTSGDLELVQDSTRQTVGMRFRNLNIPSGATITRAWVQFTVDDVSSASARLAIAAHAADNAPAFSSAQYDVSSRPRTTRVTPWSPYSWPTEGAAGAAQRTPDLRAVVQEVVGRSGWRSGNALVIIVTGYGSRSAESFDGSAAKAPLLHVEYTT